MYQSVVLVDCKPLDYVSSNHLANGRAMRLVQNHYNDLVVCAHECQTNHNVSIAADDQFCLPVRKVFVCAYTIISRQRGNEIDCERLALADKRVVLDNNGPQYLRKMSENFPLRRVPLRL